MKGKEIGNITMDLVSRGRLQEAIGFLRLFDLLELNKEVCQISFIYHSLQKKEKILDWNTFHVENNKVSWSILSIAEELILVIYR
ncbi:MAG: hypothetical protein R2799_14325 [Crocinitomicaceae bacterium]